MQWTDSVPSLRDLWRCVALLCLDCVNVWQHSNWQVKTVMTVPCEGVWGGGWGGGALCCWGVGTVRILYWCFSSLSFPVTCNHFWSLYSSAVYKQCSVQYSVYETNFFVLGIPTLHRQSQSSKQVRPKEITKRNRKITKQMYIWKKKKPKKILVTESDVIFSVVAFCIIFS